jgi:16S rRNA processing protein RimM
VLRLTPKGAVVARVKGVTNRNAAEALKGRKLFIARAAMPEPEDEDDFYYSDLIGLTAVDADGNAMGELVAVHNYGAGDLLEIRLAATKKTELIPFTKTVVPKINLPGRRLTVVMPVTVEGEKKGETTDSASQSDP